jgi:hypothetical protein
MCCASFPPPPHEVGQFFISTPSHDAFLRAAVLGHPDISGARMNSASPLVPVLKPAIEL